MRYFHPIAIALIGLICVLEFRAVAQTLVYPIPTQPIPPGAAIKGVPKAGIPSIVYHVFIKDDRWVSFFPVVTPSGTTYTINASTWDGAWTGADLGALQAWEFKEP